MRSTGVTNFQPPIAVLRGPLTLTRTVPAVITAMLQGASVAAVELTTAAETVKTSITCAIPMTVTAVAS